MYVQNKNIVARKIYDSFYLIDITDNYAGQCCCLYEINEIGKFIWDMLAQPVSCEHMVDSLYCVVSEPDIDRDVISEDVDMYLCVLTESGFVEEVAG